MKLRKQIVEQHGVQPEDVAFTPKGGCPLKLVLLVQGVLDLVEHRVAFTPKGGCPLKLSPNTPFVITQRQLTSSIHPQGWVPIETRAALESELGAKVSEVAFTPKGGCPLKLEKL